MEKLEAYREYEGLSQREMAKAFGLSSAQVYSQWVARDSLPKKHRARARRILEEGLYGDDYDGGLWQHMSEQDRVDACKAILLTLTGEARADIIKFTLEI